MDAVGHPKSLVTMNVSPVSLPGDFSIFWPSLIRVCESGQVAVTEHSLNALAELTEYEGKDFK